MESTVSFRDFEERDIDFIYKCKNDEKLNCMIVGQFRQFSYEDATKWVHGCMGVHDTYKFWAICTNDEEKRIVGWVSLSAIDKENKSACLHGMVIGDMNYRDGLAWVESHQFVFSFVFEELGLNRLYGESIVGHKQSNLMEDVMFFTREGIKRQAIFKNDRFYDLSFVSILRNEYLEHKNSGEYETKSIVKRIVKLNKLRNKK